MYYEFFVTTFLFLTRSLRNFAKNNKISFDNNIKYSDFIAGKYIYIYICICFAKLAFKKTLLFKEKHV